MILIQENGFDENYKVLLLIIILNCIKIKPISNNKLNFVLT
jgi:hypothetical protein